MVLPREALAADSEQGYRYDIGRPGDPTLRSEDETRSRNRRLKLSYRRDQMHFLLRQPQAPSVNEPVVGVKDVCLSGTYIR